MFWPGNVEGFSRNAVGKSSVVVLPRLTGPRTDMAVGLWITSQLGPSGPRLPPTSRVGLPTGIQQTAKPQVSGPNRVNSVLSFRYAPW